VFYEPASVDYMDSDGGMINWMGFSLGPNCGTVPAFSWKCRGKQGQTSR
jgi:hypothetical protein